MEKLLMRFITVAMFGVLIAGIMANFIPIYLSEQGYSTAEIGFIYAIGSILVLLSPVFAILADRWGRRRFIQISLILTSIAYFIYTINAYGAKVLESLGSATWFIRPVIADLAPKKKLSSILAYMTGMETLTWMGGSILGGIVIQNIGFTHSFYLSALLLFLISFIIPKFKEKHKIKKMKVEWHFPREMVLLYVIALMWGFGAGARTIMYPLIYSEFFVFDVIYIGAFIGIEAVTFALPLFVFRGKLDKLNPKKMILYSAAFCVIVNTLIFFNRDFILFYLLTMASGAFFAFVPPSIDRLIADASRKKYMAFDMSFARTIFFLGIMFGSLIVGPTTSLFGLFGLYTIHTIEFLIMVAVMLFGLGLG